MSEVIGDAPSLRESPRPLKGHQPYPPYADLITLARCDTFDIWDRSMRRRQGWRAGLTFWRRTSGGTLNIASRHWPHLLCWQWILSWQGPRYAQRQLFRFWRLDRDHWGLRLLWLGQIVYQRQHSDRIAAFGLRDAPQDYPSNRKDGNGERAK